MEQHSKKNKIYWLALASLFLGVVSLIWGIAGFIAIILGFIALKKIKKLGVKYYKELAILGIILGVVGIALWLGKSYFIFKSVYQPEAEEIEISLEDVKGHLRYRDACIGIVNLVNGVYEDYNYVCGDGTPAKISFEIYNDEIVIGDLNGDGRNDVATIIKKKYGEDNEIIIYELAVSINKVILGAKERMLIPETKVAFLDSTGIEGIKIENSIISIDVIRCCPTKKENIKYILQKETKTLEAIE